MMVRITGQRRRDRTIGGQAPTAIIGCPNMTKPSEHIQQMSIGIHGCDERVIMIMQDLEQRRPAIGGGESGGKAASRWLIPLTQGALDIVCRVI
jgi:hypothetical protein